MGDAWDAFTVWKDDLDSAKSSWEYATEQYALFVNTPFINTIDRARVAIDHLGNTVGPMLNAIERLTKYARITGHLKSILSRTATWSDWFDANPPDGEVTAEAIIKAWFEADKVHRQYTICAIDLLRKEIWNEHIDPLAVIDWYVLSP